MARIHSRAPLSRADGTRPSALCLQTRATTPDAGFSSVVGVVEMEVPEMTKRLAPFVVGLILATGLQGPRPAVASGPEPCSAGSQTRESPCPGSTLLCNHDGTFEINGCAWVDGGVARPYYGAFAEGFVGTGVVCGMQFDFTTLPGYQTGQTMDAYVWDSDGTNPTTVLGVTTGIDPGPVAIWYDVSVHDVDVNDVAVDGPFFVGFWGDWPGADQPGWWVAADFDSPGLPRTNVAPGLGYPTGWQSADMFDGRIRSLGICAYLGQPGVPAQESTWGRIKSLYSSSGTR
jgi:hypothetical protein